MDIKKYDIRYHKSIENWDEALPLGNGKLGCLIYGNGPLRFALDRVDLWDTRPHPYTKEAGFCYKNLVKLSTSGKEEDWKERQRLFEKIAGKQYPYPSKITAGRIEFDFGFKTDNIQSHIDITRAIGEINIENGQKRIEIFLSATKFIGVARVWGEYALNLHIPAYISGAESENFGYDSVNGEKNSLCFDYPKTAVIRDGKFIFYRQKTYTDFEYGTVVLQKKYNGYNELYFTIATNKDGDDFIVKAQKELETVSNLGYERLKSEHIAWWNDYWKKSEINIGDELIEKTYYRSYYLFASCSRKGFYPMPLQGVWTADNDCLPPWRGDYHHDTNTQLSYQSFLKANRLEEGEVFIDYLWEMRDAFRKFAKEFYEVEGLLIPACSTLDGKPIGGWAQYSFSPTMTIWVAQSFDEYWLYSGNVEFLRERAYPFFEEVGRAIFALLKEKDGKLYLPLSSSPEIFDASPQAYLKPNSNFDLSLLLYLYKTLSDYAKILGIDGTFYKEVLNKLDDIAINQDGVVMLDQTQKLPITHRHFSHLMCLYPLHLINYDTKENQRIYNETIFDMEILGSGLWVGFSYAMFAQIYAMAKRGNSAYERLRQFANGYVADNGFHLNGDFKKFGYSAIHYRPFTLESLFGYCDALQEMLLQEHQGYLEIFPAVPDEWKQRRISFKNLRSYDGILVSATGDGGKLKELILISEKDKKVKIRNAFEVEQVYLAYEKEVISINDDEGMLEVNLHCGKNKLYVNE